MSTATSAAYYDFQSLSSLRAQAVQAPDQALEEVAGQFESLFVQMMVKSMRDATIEGGLFNGNQMEVYQGMLDQQMSLHLSSQGAIGLADILKEQLQGFGASEEPAEDGNSPAAVPSEANALASYFAQARPAVSSPPLSTTEPPGVDAVGASGESEVEQPWRPSSAEEFVRDVWDHAVSAAQELGLDPAVLVAQSALETGWGKRVIEALDGSSSFNLFGIKASPAWSGKSANVDTLEYRDGVAEREHASFRVYDSIASSFSDYVDFLKNNSRYQDALGKVDDAQQFLQGLQDAGYATDPNYADKIMNIMNTSSMGSALSPLKIFGN